MKTENRKKLILLLTSKAVGYDGLEEDIDWTDFTQDEIADIIICNPDKEAMRLYILEKGFLYDTASLVRVMAVYSHSACDTFLTIIEKHGTVLSCEIMLLFLEVRSRIRKGKLFLAEQAFVFRYCRQPDM